jgi:hypothetical protein
MTWEDRVKALVVAAALLATVGVAVAAAPYDDVRRLLGALITATVRDLRAAFLGRRCAAPL